MDMTTRITDAPTPPDISIVIPHYNDVDRLGRCLTALMRNDVAMAEILVVDNASPQPPDHLRALFPTVRFLTEFRKGAGPARNRGVAESQASVLAFLDADCVPNPDWLTVARQVATTADLIAGRVDVFDETPPPRSGPEAFEQVFAFDFRNYVEVQGFSGAGNLITHREVFQDVGPFLTLVSEDKEWTMRATARGHRLIYDDRLRVGHPSRADWPGLRQKWLRLTQELFASAQLAEPGIKTRVRWTIRGLAMPISALVHLPKLLFSPKLNGAGERLRGGFTLIRLRFTRMLWMLSQAFGTKIN